MLRAAAFRSTSEGPTPWLPGQFSGKGRPGLSHIAHPNLPPERSKLTAAFHHLEAQLTKYFTEKKAA